MNFGDYLVQAALKIRAEMLGQDIPVASSVPAPGSREERLANFAADIAPRKPAMVAAAEKLAAEMRARAVGR